MYTSRAVKILMKLVFLQALLAAPQATAEIRILAQMGANQGLIAAGIAGEHDLFAWATTFGLTPSVEGDAVITQLNLKTGFNVYQGDDVRMMLGPAVLLNSSDETFFVLPERYPDGYYPPNAYFFALQSAWIFKNGYFFEASMLDYYFEILARNPRGSMSNSEMISFGFGKIF